MPSSKDRQELGTEEIRESPVTGPFGGIQSELPVSLIEEYGFANSQNIAFRFGTAQARPTYTTLPTPPGFAVGEFVTTFAVFWDSLGRRQQVVFTNNAKIYTWSGVAWTQLAGPVLGPLVGFPTAPFATAVLNQRLCFSNGGRFNNIAVYIYDPVGNPGNYTLAPNSQQPLCLAEIGLHLMSSDVTVIAVGLKPQRYQWSGAGDPTDWVSFSSGVNDQLTDIGPASGLLKLGQYGFGFHPFGILQIIPTGLGSAPFAFVPIAGGNIGPAWIYTLQKLCIGGLDCGLFVGPDNVYVFNQTSLLPIGDAPIGQRRRLGARARILADLAPFNPAVGARSYVSYAPGSSPYLTYMILVRGSNTDPTLCPLWIYNFDEENWTRWIFDKVPVALGDFSLNASGITIIPVGGIKIGISFFDGTIGYIDFGQAGSETSTLIKSGKCIFGDRRHRRTNKKFRLAFTDLGSITWTLTLTNEAGQTAQQSATLGTNSGDDLSYVFNVPLPGLRIQWTLTAPSGSKFAVVECAPMFDVGGEQRGGTVDGN